MKRIASEVSGVRLMKVGVMKLPPLTSAPTAASAWIGATARPWPKAIVAVLISPQR